jgi:hypothetical protein
MSTSAPANSEARGGSVSVVPIHIMSERGKRERGGERETREGKRERDGGKRGGGEGGERMKWERGKIPLTESISSTMTMGLFLNSRTASLSVFVTTRKCTILPANNS